MNSLVALVTCIQLFNSHVLAFRRVVTFSAVPCDAVGAVNAAKLGIHHINSIRREGYKYSLNMVTNALEKQKAFGECKIIIHVSKGFPNVKDYHCSEYPASVGNPCRGCLYTFQPLKSGDVDRAVNIALRKYNSKSKDISYFSLYNITKILPRSKSSQMISVEFIIQETNCFKDNLTVVLSSCVPKRHKFAHLGICTVSFVPESPVHDVAEVTCEIYATKGVTVQSLSGQEEPLEDNYQDEEQKFIPKFKRSISRPKDQRMKQSGMSKECRGTDSSSSESSEEQNICSHREPLKQPTTQSFPSLPPHALTCPGQPRYIAKKY
ncbi:antihemorrhagic factor BJ46a-like isoform X2 [Rhinoraja longicauda]